MKVGILVWRLDLTGGTEKQALELARCLQDMGHFVEVYTFYFDKERCHPELVSKIRNIICLKEGRRRQDNNFRRALNHLDMFLKSKKVASLIRSDLDVLNCHEYTTFPTAAVYKKNNPKVALVGMINDAPSFNGIYELKDNPFKFLLSFLKRKIYDPYIKEMDSLAVLDTINLNRLKKYHCLDSQIIRSGCDLSKFKYVKKNVPNPIFKILTNGTFCVWRRYEDVVRALEILRKRNIAFEWNHLGSEATSKKYAKKVKDLVRSLGLTDFVKFQGRVSEEKHKEFFMNSDVFVFPNDPQTWGLVVFEALAAGLPAVISEKCGAAEVLKNKENVLLVPPRQPEKIADAMIELKSNQDLWKMISENGRKFVEENIRWDIYAKNMLGLFEKTLKTSYVK